MGVGWSAKVRQGETGNPPRIGPVRQIWVWQISSKALRLHGNQWSWLGVFFCGFCFQSFFWLFLLKPAQKLLGKIDLNSRSFLVVVVLFSPRRFGGNDPIWLGLSHIFQYLKKTEVIGELDLKLKQQIFFQMQKRKTGCFFPQDVCF